MKAKKRTVVGRGSQEKEDPEWYLLEYLHQQVPVSHASRGELKGGGATSSSPKDFCCCCDPED